jgi:hypothetical protein
MNSEDILAVLAACSAFLVTWLWQSTAAELQRELIATQRYERELCNIIRARDEDLVRLKAAVERLRPTAEEQQTMWFFHAYCETLEDDNAASLAEDKKRLSAMWQRRHEILGGFLARALQKDNP